jgi:3D (Asp-Asp-Asp) domain-containing protein
MSGRLRALAVALAAVLLLSGTAGALEPKAANVTLIINDQVQQTYATTARNVEEFLSQLEMVVFEGDVVTPGLEAVLRNGQTVSIDRAFSVFVLIKGPNGDTVSEARTTDGTVFGFVAKYSSDTDSTYTYDYALRDFALVPNMLLTLELVLETDVVTYFDIPYETVTHFNSSIYVGETEIAQEGAAGVEKLVENVIFQGQDIVFNRVESVSIVSEPVTKIVHVGTKATPTPVPSPTPRPTVTPTVRPAATPVPSFAPFVATTPNPETKTETFRDYNGDEFTFTNVLTMTATAYEPGPRSTGKSPGHPLYRITATGMWAQVGVVAVDPKVIPLHTRLYVPGYGFAVAGDTGVRGNRIDLFFETEAECIQFGIKTVTVYILP